MNEFATEVAKCTYIREVLQPLGEVEVTKCSRHYAGITLIGQLPREGGEKICYGVDRGDTSDFVFMATRIRSFAGSIPAAALASNCDGSFYVSVPFGDGGN